jgi:hypothetical protein
MNNHPPNLITLSRASNYNDAWPVRDLFIKQCLDSFLGESDFKNFTEPNFNYQTYAYGNDDLEQQAFLHVVSETVFDYPHVFITEKTFKPIVYKRPFVLLAPIGSLQNLKDLGFQTFQDFWDESYDCIPNPEQRLLAVSDIVTTICSMTIDELKNLCVSMQDVLNYNFSHYFENFKQNMLDSFEQECEKNLGPRYD